MGEAKRRKQLGLMPEVHAFEAHMDADGAVTFTRVPQDAALRDLIEGALKVSQPYGAAWDSEYRTSYVMAGRPDRFLETAEDVQAIPVPPLRRFSGDLVLGKAATEGTGMSFPVEGGSVRLREQRHSFDGQRWDSFPAHTDPRRALEYLLQHPALNLQGELVATFLVEQWAEGRIDVTPEPPDDLLEALEGVAREWHGDTPELWSSTHHDLLEQDEDGPVPVARRLVLDLRRPAPLHSPLSLAFATHGNVEFHPNTEKSTYSLDGELWHPYGDPDGEGQEDELHPELAQFFDVETASVTVHADGHVEWEDGAIPDEHAEHLRTDLRESTGAGNQDSWAAWTSELLRSTFDHELTIPEDAALPVPLAVRLDIPLDALSDPDPLAQTFMESEITFDGTQWRDLYDEEIPEELRPFAAGNAAN
ncbi:hypothetical protein GCM10008955_12950 [Deinococcus malanensis]|uniref:Uncharacterized protein n=1 Tax=Deinococcus malanensis TaxID=1706855 RepID=A0ABQ2EU87_9DEIO|nr:hypothetical protein [Deinococcus malanensis]GGK20911.1 hypothetical protein GCM10008955_12950 [Deinococcus malanensis]